MTKKYFYIFLLSFVLNPDTRKASFLLRSSTKKEMDKLALEALAVHDTIADPQLSSFNDLISISKVEKPESIDIYENYKPAVGNNFASNKCSGPIVTTKDHERIAYSTLTASLANSALEIVQYKLRALNKPNERLSYFLKEWHLENINRLDETPFHIKERNFIFDFSSTLKSLDKAENWSRKPYFIKFESCDRLERKFFSYRELALRSLSCLLIASPDIDDVGKKIVKEVLKDQEVLEIIKLQFSTILMNSEFDKDIYLNFKDFLMHNNWSKGFANIFDVIYPELSEMDQHYVFNSSLKQYVKFYNYFTSHQRKSATEFRDIYQVLNFFEEPQTLNKLSNLNRLSNSNDDLSGSVARTLIGIVSVPGHLDRPNNYAGIWSFAYYIVESLVTDPNSLFLKIYQDIIQKDSLIEKIEFLKKCIYVKKRANEFFPSRLIIRPREKSQVWKQLGDDSIASWFNQYFIKLNQLEKDLKKQFNQCQEHLKSNENFEYHTELYKRNSKEPISSKLGGLLSTEIIKHFLTEHVVKPKLETEKYKPIMQIAYKLNRLYLKEEKKNKKKQATKKSFIFFH
ncbi:expressed protein [Phakopsora pachyrhizi]|uniref:Expressed protein n=1 Tax=Phakopsora pachyrhizi TaxID=170000 RepID=A0AAV0BCI0_PHAPC|nr:expressed protein [Phakopsora pachyrhizi]